MEKKDQVCQAALRLFNRYGLDKAPTSQIAKEARVATGTLFHYFSNSLYIHELTRVEGRNKFDGLIGLLREGMDTE